MEKYVAVSVCVCFFACNIHTLFGEGSTTTRRIPPTTTPFSFGGEERLENEIGPFSWAQDRGPPAAASSHHLGGSKKK